VVFVFYKQIVIAFSLSVLLGCAGTQSESRESVSEAEDWRDDCIHQPSVRGYKVLDEQNLLIDAAGRRTYHVVLRRRAHGLRSSFGIAFDSPGSRVCAGFSEIIFDGSMMSAADNKIRIQSIRQLSEAEEEHLLIQFGKKEPEIEQTPVPQDVKGADVEELDLAEGD